LTDRCRYLVHLDAGQLREAWKPETLLAAPFGYRQTAGCPGSPVGGASMRLGAILDYDGAGFGDDLPQAGHVYHPPI
jgi:hypothetical protein